jgi:hypothetical protein
VSLTPEVETFETLDGRSGALSTLHSFGGSVALVSALEATIGCTRISRNRAKTFAEMRPIVQADFQQAIARKWKVDQDDITVLKSVDLQFSPEEVELISPPKFDGYIAARFVSYRAAS